MSAGTARSARGTWTRALGVTLVRTTPAAVASDPALLRALTDGTERSATPALPPTPDGAEWFEVRAGGVTAGVAIVQRDCPRPGEATLLAVAIAREARGRATATHALLAAERRLVSEGCAPMYARVPRTNGRGLYFMLRAGFTPLPAAERPSDDGDATWFARIRSR
ncbi:MAG: GNAT family N-acetyltransferase [Dehalococcoidia bacterium]